MKIMSNNESEKYIWVHSYLKTETLGYVMNRKYKN